MSKKEKKLEKNLSALQLNLSEVSFAEKSPRLSFGKKKKESTPRGTRSVTTSVNPLKSLFEKSPRGYKDEDSFLDHVFCLLLQSLEQEEISSTPFMMPIGAPTQAFTGSSLLKWLKKHFSNSPHFSLTESQIGEKLIDRFFSPQLYIQVLRIHFSL